jgi:thiamine biosynthesis protein ThiS
MMHAMCAAMKLEINGEMRSVPASATIRELLENLEIKPDRIAVELNRRIIKSKDWHVTPVKEADRIEIVQFVGGG